MAKHVMSIHLNSASSLTNTQGDIDIAMMKKIVAYCRCRCAPTLSLEVPPLFFEFECIHFQLILYF